MIGNREVEDECRKALEKYSVGSCGPRGFYGTVDTHLHLEEDIANFFQVPEVNSSALSFVFFFF